jgi:hypothetical protein
MNTKDLVTITTVALGTATLTVATFLGNTIEAGNDANPPTPTIARPELVADGVRMTLAASTGCELKAGEAPSFDLQAVNTLDKSAEVRVRLTMTAVAPTSPLSRMIALPMELWHEDRAITLTPNETKTLTFHATTNLPVNKLFSVSMLAIDSTATPEANGNSGAPANPSARLLANTLPGVVGFSFSTVTKAAAPTVALVQVLPE